MTPWREAAFLAALAGCATPQTRPPVIDAGAVAKEALAQQQFVINSRTEDAKRVETIYHRLSVANLDFCKHTSGSIGAGFHELSDYPKTFRDAARAVGVPDRAAVNFVL